MSYPAPYPLSSEQELFFNKWQLRRDLKYDLISKMKDGKEKDREGKKFLWSIREDSFASVFGDEMQDYLECKVMDSYPDQVVNKKEESSGDELQGESSCSEEEEEELEQEAEDIDHNDNENSDSYSSGLTTM